MNNSMPKLNYRILISLVLLLSPALISGCAHLASESAPQIEISFIEINPDITLRRMVVPNWKAKGVVLFLHGFPETMYTWKELALKLGQEYEVQAFDWPGYGQSSRPPVEKFSYSPKDYANVLRDYIKKEEINSSELLIYATDIGSLPVLLLALEDPGIMSKIIVGDFAPFDRPQYMFASLQNLKEAATAAQTRAFMNKNKDEILQNAFFRGLTQAEHFEIPPELKDDMANSWTHDSITSADAFYYYYSKFTRDQNFLESHIKNLQTPLKVIWGEKDIYIKKEMGQEFARKLDIDLKVLPNTGHYPHLQNPHQTISEINSSFSR